MRKVKLLVIVSTCNGSVAYAHAFARLSSLVNKISLTAIRSPSIRSR